MADTKAVALTKDDWVQLDDDTNFIFQNTNNHRVYVKVDATKPTDLSGAFVLEPWKSMTRLSTGVHWVYTFEGNMQGSYAVNDL